MLVAYFAYDGVPEHRSKQHLLIRWDFDWINMSQFAGVMMLMVCDELIFMTAHDTIDWKIDLMIYTI